MSQGPDVVEPQPAIRPAAPLDAATWTRIGLLSFGGPAGQIALMQRMLVDERRWIDPARFLAALNLCMLLPGPEAQQLATYIGWHRAGWRGALVAGVLFVAPGALVMLALSAAYVAWGRVPLVEAAFLGVKCAVVAIVFEALVRVARRALVFRGSAAIALAAFVAIFAFDAPYPAVVIAALLVGALSGGGAHGPASESRRAPRTLAPGLVALLAWLAPTALLFHAFGTDHVLSRVAAFYSELAVTTFGGAYAVLGYVADRAVGDYGWLTAAQMADGLGLAETTPGPLILVLQFVAFLAGHDAGGAGLALAASAVALVALFAPSFAFILLAAPHVERLNADPRLRGALRAVTAAVVGVIASLSLWFATHVLFARVGRLELASLAMPWPDFASFDPRAVMPLVASFLLLFVAKRGIVAALAACAALGLATSWLSSAAI